MKKTSMILMTCVLFFLSCSAVKQVYQLPVKLEAGDVNWVNSTINNMSLDEKIGQMFMPFARYESYYSHPDRLSRLKELLLKYHVGGFVIRSGNVCETIKFNNQLQSAAKIPLFIAADYETGVGGRTDGGTEFISMMGVGATNNPDYAYEVGKITALESRAIGINLLFAPCADVNTNSLNKIINIRSFGEDPEKVGKFVAAFVEGAQQNGILATVKHFPGHGGTAIDSHHELPVLSSDLNQLQRQDLIPFKEAIKSKVAAVMTAHIALPKVAEEKEVPATLSWKILDELLRENLQFNGLVITDALAMDAVKDNYFEGISIVKAIHAGVDILLVPQNLPLTFYTVQQAVKRGDISIDRINQSVRRILTWKSRLGINKTAIVSEKNLDKELSNSSYQKNSDEIAHQAVTVLHNTVLPLKLDRNLNLLVFSFSDRQNTPVNGQYFVNRLRELNESAKHFQINPVFCASDVDKILSEVHESDYVINTFHFRRTSSPETLPMTEFQVKLLDSLESKNDSVINIFFGSPYYAMNFPNSKNLVFMYRNSPHMQKIAADMVTGKYDVKGKLPVSIPNIASIGEGEKIDKYSMKLEKVDYKNYVAHGEYIDSLKFYLQKSITDNAFPGCAIAVGYKGNLLFSEGFGHFTYDSGSNEVKPNSIFDLASVTKVVSTTSAAMILYERGLLNLDWLVQDVLPDFTGSEKGMVTIRHLLTHSSGLPAWRRYYLTLKGQDQILNAIYSEALEFTPGTLILYSDLGMILMQKIIEVITQKPLNQFVDENIFQPLGMTRTFYNPDKSYLNDIVPTEKSDWHKKVVHGFVHDENTFAMGGVSGHAGLFSTADDLAKYCQLLLNGGIYNQKRIFKKSTIELFTKREEKLKGSTRAIGWDTRSEEHSSAGHFMSMKTFGHLGFTGTSIWIDPENDLFVVFLTNRVHPTRENIKIRKVRPMVHDYVMKAILGHKISTKNNNKNK